MIYYVKLGINNAAIPIERINFAAQTTPDMLRTNNCGELTIANVGSKVTLCGWVQRSRDLGGMTFIDLRDRYGITQLAFNLEVNKELCEEARKVGMENSRRSRNEKIVDQLRRTQPKVPT